MARYTMDFRLSPSSQAMPRHRISEYLEAPVVAFSHVTRIWSASSATPGFSGVIVIPLLPKPDESLSSGADDPDAGFPSTEELGLLAVDMPEEWLADKSWVNYEF